MRRKGHETMAKFLISRLLWAIPVVLVILVFNFVLTRMAPGDPITAIVGEFPAPDAYIAQLREALGLDQPIWMQLWLYLGQVFQGDLGYSFANRQPVLDLIMVRAGNTLALMVPGLILASILGVVLGRLSLLAQGKFLDNLLTGISLFGYSVPVFWFGQILIILFAVELQALPAQGMRSLRPDGPLFLDYLAHWVLPGFVVTIFYAAIVARVARASLKDASTGDFVLTALAKSGSDRRVFWRHVLPNGLIPIISVIGYNFGLALTGAILVESVFAWPGLGSLFMQSIVTRDYATLQGIFILAGTSVVLANIITDALYGVVDPRVRHGSHGR
jgi:peptide/nickel transport system permease protein